MQTHRSALLAGLALFAFVALQGRAGGEGEKPDEGAQKKDAPAAAPELKTPKEKTSYALGRRIGQSLRDELAELDLAVLFRGIQDVRDGKAILSDADCNNIMQTFQREAMARRTERQKAQGETNRKEGEAFLAANKTKPGVETTASGLQYKVLTAGTGPKPKVTDTVTTHYRGTLLSGKEFDSSFSRGEPTSFPVTGVIAGWTEALQLMPVGSKWQLFIPSDLAYGERGAGNDIGPNATLIFEIELLKIEEK